MRPVKLNVPLSILVSLTVTSCGGGVGSSAPPPPLGPAGIYHIDCSATSNGNGTQSSPWNSLASANAIALNPGNQLLFKRGTTCQGALTPTGSGAAGAPIIVDAYGTGAQPVIDGGTSNAVVALVDQQYWEFRNLEITGGNRFGIFIWGNTPNSSLNHLHLVNLNVHGAHYTSTVTADSGEVYISPAGLHQVVNDVLIDGVMAHDSHVSEGIEVLAGGDVNGEEAACQQQPTPAQDLGNGVKIQNSTVHDVYGDGIHISGVSDGLMQSNVVYNTGLCPNCNRSTSGLWQFCCHSCTVQNNESYANHPGGAFPYDGGAFDFDLYNDDNVLQYNYGHDSDGYCVLVLGDARAPTRISIFRYNICSNNGRNAGIPPQGDVLVLGSIDGVQIYNNTFYWNPAVESALFMSRAAAGSDSRLFKNNIIYSSAPAMIAAGPGFVLDYNLYWTTAAAGPTWKWNGTDYATLAAYQTGSGQDAHSRYVDPALNTPTYHDAGRPQSAFTLLAGSPARGAGVNVCLGISTCTMGTQDFYGNPLPSTGAVDIGAQQAP